MRFAFEWSLKPLRAAVAFALSLAMVVAGLPATAIAEEYAADDAIKVVENSPDQEPEPEEEDAIEEAPIAAQSDADDPTAVESAQGGMGLGFPVKSIHDENEDWNATAQSGIPSSYDSRQSSLITAVRNQNPFGVCWAFASVGAVEASLLKRQPVADFTKDNLHISERQLAYFAFNRPNDPLHNTDGDSTNVAANAYGSDSYQNVASYLNNGGSAGMVAHTMASWTGPILESDDDTMTKYGALQETYYMYQQQYRAGASQYTFANFLSATNLPESYAHAAPVARLKNSYWVNPGTDPDALKQLIMDYGAAALLIYDGSREECDWPKVDNISSGTGGVTTRVSYYFYCKDKRDSNHLVTVVGWDDSISRNKFGSESYGHPSRDGAWLCKNSWGGGSHSTWDGYFWLSYDDEFVARNEDSFAVAFEMEEPGKQDNNYQYDGTNSLFYNMVDSGGSIANVYEAKANAGGELLSNVSFVLYDTNVDYSVQVYTDLANEADPTSGTPALETPLTGKTSYEGIYKLDLPSEVPLQEGTKFSVVVTLSHANSEPVCYSVDATNTSGWYRSYSHVEAGQSFEKDRANAAWEDLSSTSYDPHDEPACCARIKAFTKNTTLEGDKNIAHARVTIPRQMYTGADLTPTPTSVTLGGVTLTTDDYEIVSYSSNRNAGTGKVVLQAKDGSSYEGTRTATFTIDPAPLKSVQVNPTSYTYDGSAKKPTATVNAGAVMVGPADYDLTYKNNTNAGTATVTAKGKGNFTGEVSTTFKINPAQITTVSVSSASVYYDGSAKQPGVTVKAGNATVPASGYSVSYANNVKAGTATATVTGKGNYTGTKSATFTIVSLPAAHVAYQTHVQKDGWQDWRRDGAMAGTSNRSLRLEGINIKLEGQQFPGSIEYRTHVQKIGWQGYVRDGVMSGTSGKSLRLEAIQIRLTGEMAQKYDVWYRVHAQTYAWMGWAKNDSPAGTAGYAKRLEGIEIRVLPKGSAAPGSQSGAFVTKNGDSPMQSYAGHEVSYRTHVQSFGWRPYVCDGQMSGTTGLAKRLEGIEIRLLNQQYPGSIEYRTHVQKIGWQDYVRDGVMSGTSGKKLRLEAIQIRLTGQMAEKYDVWYRVHAQTFGWMGWAKNDQQAGTAGYGKRLECLEVLVLPKGSPAPGPTGGVFRQR